MAVYSFIAEERASHDNDWTVAEMCRVLEVSRSGFYGWRNRPPSEREATDAMLAIEIEAIWECSDRTYGAPRTHRWLRKQGFRVGRKRVARIMRVNGFDGESGRRRIRTTIVDRGATAASDLVGRGPNGPRGAGSHLGPSPRAAKGAAASGPAGTGAVARGAGSRGAGSRGAGATRGATAVARATCGLPSSDQNGR